MRRDVRILLVGEPGVGKTSLILSLISEEFPEDVPPRAEEITVPADVIQENIPTTIVDFCAQEQSDEELTVEIQKAHVICIVYSVEDEETIEKITSYWIPLVRQVVPEENRKPIVLVGNKSDVLEVSSMESILPIMNEVEVETCVECSARTLKNISEVFYYAQKAVLHPTAPVYILEEKVLTAKCIKALTRIFRICDQDNDGLLNDSEIYKFQRRCFNLMLEPQSLEDIKVVVRTHMEDGVVDDCITFQGFLYLHKLFIELGRHETTWTVLRKFGYDDNLQLTQEYLCPHIKVPSTCSTELSHLGQQFLNTLFDKYDEDGDGALSPTELTNLFSTCPSMPWGPDVNNSVQTNAQGWITRDGYLAQWAMTSLLDVQRTLELLAHLGYLYEHEDTLSAIHVTRDKRLDLQKQQTSRTVFRCHVIGPKGVGKTAFLQGFLGRNLKYVATLTKDHISRFAVNVVQVYGQERQLVLQEMDIGRGLSDIMSTPELNCDVACLLYDVTNPRSFDVCAKIYSQFLANRNVPVLVVGCKAEAREVPQDYELQPAQFCHKHKLAPPQMFTCIDDISHEIYTKLATMAQYPHVRTIYRGDKLVWVKIGVGIAALAGLGVLLYKFVRRR